jgi:Siphovirus-type tail component, C-terminal domain
VPILVSGTPSTPSPVTLAAGYYQKPFPAPGVTVPALAPYQFWFNGLTMGPNTSVELKKINGLDLPTIRSGDSERPREHGMFVGLDVMSGGELTLEGDLQADGVSFAHAWQALSSATVPMGVVEAPLYMGLPGYGTLVSMCRVRKRSIPIDIQFALGELAGVTLLFAASDPRLYSTPTQTASVSPPGTSSGFTFPLTFPLSFGGGGVAGVLSLNNTGNIEVKPILTIEGPCKDPSITLASAEGSPNLTFELEMAAGDRLVLNTDMHTATYYTAGSTIGATRWYTLAPGSQWFTLPPGVSTLQFLTRDPTPSGTLTAEWASGNIL